MYLCRGAPVPERSQQIIPRYIPEMGEPPPTSAPQGPWTRHACPSRGDQLTSESSFPKALSGLWPTRLETKSHELPIKWKSRRVCGGMFEVLYGDSLWKPVQGCCGPLEAGQSRSQFLQLPLLKGSAASVHQWTGSPSRPDHT